jgi:hypothetical protein
MMPTEPANQSWWALPVNMTRRLPGMLRASLSRSGHTLWLPQKVFTCVPSGFTVQSACARQSGLSVYSHRV